MRPDPRAVAVVASALLAGCAVPNVPRLDLPGADASNEAAERLVEDKLWAGEGGYLAFLSDGTLIAGTCAAPARLGAWRWVDDGVLAWEEAGGTIRAEIAAVGPDQLILLPRGEEPVPARRFRAGRSPGPCGMPDG